MRIVIIEDENLAALRLKKMILNYSTDIEIVAELESVSDSVKWFRTNPEPDLIFLDIQLEDDLSFAIFEQVNISAPIIFTTAFDEYAIRAFKHKSIDYLLKPIVQEELNAALKKYNELVGKHQIDLESLYGLLINKEKKYRERFSVSIGNKIRTFTIHEVAYFMSEDGFTSACLRNSSRYPVDMSLNKLSGELNPDQFFRINRQVLVNIHAIQEIHIHSGSRLKIDLHPKTENTVFVSVDKVSEFKKWINGKK